MNILLTGEIGIGKSTVVNRVVSASGVNAGGMITKFKDRESPFRKLYISDLGSEAALEVVSFKTDSPPEVKTEVFDSFGRELVEAASGYELAIIDELGFFERDALNFQKAIFWLLDSPANVLGVIKPDDRGWLSGIRARDDITIITVTTDNRDNLPGHVIGLFGLKA